MNPDPRHPLPRRLVRLVALAGLLGGCSPSGPSGTGATDAGSAADLAAIPEAYARSTAALMWPGATRAFQVTPAGDLYNGAWIVRLRPSAGDADAVAAEPAKIAFE